MAHNIMKKLPLGIQNFSEIRNDKYVYIDKTQIASNLIQSGKYYFLSRPRRFGKSLFLDTLKCLFEGKKELFKGLYIYDKWGWNKKYPVIKISFGGDFFRSSEYLEKSMFGILEKNERDNGVSVSNKMTIGNYFKSLIEACHAKHQMPVAVLVDEYDKPILDNITDEATALDIRNILRGFYTAIKDSDEYVKFVFLTGVSKFSKMNLFSGLNNLRDITLSAEYNAICGYSQKDIEYSFQGYLKGLDLKNLKKWYNGYSFSGEPLYNPYDILLFFQEGRRFKSYWFETGTPTFMVDMIREKKYYLPNLENVLVAEDTLNTFDVGNIPIESLLFQTGYLTIKGIKASRIEHIDRYHLGFPNFEVRYAFLSHFIDYMTEAYSDRGNHQDDIYSCLEKLEPQRLEGVLKSLFAGISYHVYVKNNIADYEGFYVSVVYAYFYSLGIDIQLEEASAKGRADMIIKFPENTVYIFEFKVVEEDKANAKKPIEQIKTRKYYEKYIGIIQNIILIGVEFSKNERNLVSFEWENIHKNSMIKTLIA